MKIRYFLTAALLTAAPMTAFAAAESLRGSPGSMERQHNVALEEELTFYRTPGAILAEVADGTLIELAGNQDYRIANVSFAYAVSEVGLFVERLAQQYRAACGEQLVVTSLTRPKSKQPRNAHELSVHPAGMAVDLRVSDRRACRSWLEDTLLALESSGVLDVTRERHPPHYHVAVFPTPYREYVERIEAAKPKLAIATPTPQQPAVHQATMTAMPARRDQQLHIWALAVALSVAPALSVGLSALRKRRNKPTS